MWAVLILALVAAVSAQIPTPCEGPASFTAKFRHFDRERKYYVEGKMYYDRDNKRIREFEEMDISGQKEYYDKLKLYDLNVEYRVDMKTRKCNVTAPRRPWHPYGVPPEGKYAGSGTIGAVGVPNEEVPIALFEGEFEGKYPFFVTVTQPDCFVVEMSSYSNTSSEHREFYDVVSGITEGDAFIPPRECV